MDDLIPLLIVILISIVGAVSNNKKRKRKEYENIVGSNQSSQNDNLLDWLNKLNIDSEGQQKPYEETMPEVETVVEKEADPIPVNASITPQRPANINIFDKYNGFISSNERKDLMEKEGVPTVVKNHISEGDLTKQVTSETRVGSKQSMFELDMRKAVIYNEILNRKYSS
jgi:hypothetical protein